MKQNSLVFALICILLTFTTTKPLSAQDPTTSCEIAFAPSFSPDDALTIPALATPVFNRDGGVETQVVQYLRDYSSNYLALHYDPVSGMTRDQAGRLSVRDTMISAFVFAENADMPTATKAVQSVLQAQIQDPTASQFGNFATYAGEEAVFDNNWSAFIGSFLLVFYHRYNEDLPDQLKTELLEAISAAASHRLCQRYSTNNNIALLSSFVLLGTGNLLENDAFLQPGWELWNRIATATVQSGFAEYNSPNYYKVDLYALGFITDYSGIPDLAAQANAVRDLLWWTITRHYHPPTQNLAGPYSRTFTDRMSYELSGIQPFLFHNSLGRIPLPMYPNYDQDEQALHAILTLLVRRSWREDWLETALTSIDTPRQIREQTYPHFEGSGAAQQITTYLTSRMSLGSTSADSPSGNGRFLIAHAVDLQRENVGVFRLWLPPTPGYNDTTIKIIQNQRSILGIVQMRYPSSETLPPTFDISFQWFGTNARPPQRISSAAPAYGAQFDVEWINVITSVRLENQFAPLESTSQLLVSQPDANALTTPLELQSSFTLTAISPEADPEALFMPLIFCIYFDEGGTEPFELERPYTGISSTDPKRMLIGWSSPDGLLEMEVSLEARIPWYFTETLDRVPIERSSLALSLPEHNTEIQ